MRSLDRAPGNIKRLAAEAQRRIGEAMAVYVRAELRAQHEKGRSLYGRRYPKPAKGNPPMLDTGLLMDGYQVEVLDSGNLRISNRVYYSQFLTEENRHEHLPIDGKMPAKWQKKLDEIKAKELKRFWQELKGTIL